MTNDFNEYIQNIYHYSQDLRAQEIIRAQDYWPRPINSGSGLAATAIADIVILVRTACENLMAVRFRGAQFTSWHRASWEDPEYFIDFAFDVEHQNQIRWRMGVSPGALLMMRREALMRYTKVNAETIINALIESLEGHVQADGNYRLKVDIIRLRIWNQIGDLARRAHCAIFDLRFNLLRTCLEIEYKLAWNENTSRRHIVIGLLDFDLLTITREVARYVINRMEVHITEDKQRAEERSGLLPFGYPIVHPMNRLPQYGFMTPEEARERIFDGQQQDRSGFFVGTENNTYHNGISQRKPDRPKACINCKHHHGATYNGNKLICGMYPYGPDSDECADWESKAPVSENTEDHPF